MEVSASMEAAVDEAAEDPEARAKTLRVTVDAIVVFCVPESFLSTLWCNL